MSQSLFLAALIMVVGSGMPGKAFDHFKDDSVDYHFLLPGFLISTEKSEWHSNERENYYSLWFSLRQSWFTSAQSASKILHWNTHIISNTKLNLNCLLKRIFRGIPHFRLPNLVGKSENPDTPGPIHLPSHEKWDCPFPVFMYARRFFTWCRRCSFTIITIDFPRKKF